MLFLLLSMTMHMPRDANQICETRNESCNVCTRPCGSRMWSCTMNFCTELDEDSNYLEDDGLIHYGPNSV